jgi:hypothetical protein
VLVEFKKKNRVSGQREEGRCVCRGKGVERGKNESRENKKKNKKLTEKYERSIPLVWS